MNVNRKSVEEAIAALGMKVIKKSQVVETPASDDLVKGVTDEITSLREDIVKAFQSLVPSADSEELTKSEVESVIGAAIDPLNDMIKSEIENRASDKEILTKAIGDITSSIEAMRGMVKSLIDEVEEISKTPIKKSYTSNDFVERNFGGKQGDDIQKGETVLSASRDKSKILDIMDASCGDFEKGSQDEGMTDAMLSYEASGILRDDIIAKLRSEKKVVIVP